MVGPGIVYEQTLNFGLYEYDDRVMMLENLNQIIITALDTQASSVARFNSVLINHGIAMFDSLTFIATQGTPNMIF